MWKMILVASVIVLVCCGCRTLLVGLDEANTAVQETAAPMADSANPYVALLGALGVAATGITAKVIAKIKKKHHLEELVATEDEKELVESLARTLTNAIEVAGDGDVKKKVASATKHSAAMTGVLEKLLADISET